MHAKKRQLSDLHVLIKSLMLSRQEGTGEQVGQTVQVATLLLQDVDDISIVFTILQH